MDDDKNERRKSECEECCGLGLAVSKAKQATTSIHCSVICLSLIVHSSIAHLTCSIFKSIRYLMHNRQQPFPSFVLIPEEPAKAFPRPSSLKPWPSGDSVLSL